LADSSSGSPGGLALAASLAVVLAVLALPGVFYWIVTAVWIARRSERSRSGNNAGSGRGWEEDPTIALPPVCFLRPVKRGVPGLADKARRLLHSARPGDRVIFGVDSQEDYAICEAACAEAPEGVGTGVVLCVPSKEGAEAGAASPVEARSLERRPRNPKIEKLIVMTGGAGTDAGAGSAAGECWEPEHWILTDSEALTDRGFMDRLRSEWAAMSARGEAAAITVGYRFTGAASFPQMFDQLAALLTLWPGLVAAEWGTGGAAIPKTTETEAGTKPRVRRDEPGGLGFALGACIAVRRSDVALVGGWEAFAGSLVEDNRLGVALATEGRATRLSREVLTLDSDPIGWLGWLLHQHRVAFTYRACNPAGAFSMVFTHGVTWSLLAAIVALPTGFTGAGWGFFAAVAFLKIAVARQNARALRFFDETPLWRFAVSTLAVSLAETAFWLVAWLPLPVRWGGRFFRVDARGRLLSATPAGGIATPAPAPALASRNP